MSSAHESLSCLVPNISTTRLELVPITPESLKSEQASDGRLSDILHCRVTPEWPLADWEPHVFELLLTMFADHPEDIGWHRYIVLRSDEGGRPVLIGSTGAFRWETDRNSAEIGYAIAPEFRLRGYALEAVAALIAWIESTGAVNHLVAHTYPELAGSIRILERCGFTFDGPGAETRTVRYRKY